MKSASGEDSLSTRGRRCRRVRTTGREGGRPRRGMKGEDERSGEGENERGHVELEVCVRLQVLV